MSLLVTRLDGSTLCVRTGGKPMGVSALMEAIADAEGVPPSEQRLVRGGKELRAGPGEPLLSGPLPPVTLCLRICGGKGGFGAMLRGKALAAGQRKTTNFDACRDLNGVRLRAVQTEKRIAEWKAQQEKKARARGAAGGVAAGTQPAAAGLADAAGSASADASAAFDLDGYYEANEAKREGTASAVAAGLRAKRQRDELEETVREAAALEGAPVGLAAGAPAGAPAQALAGGAAKAARVGPAAAAAPGSTAARKAPAAPPATACASKWTVLDEPSSGDDDDSDEE